MLPPTGRKKELRPTLLQEFRTLVAEQGMSADTISIKQNKGIKLYNSHQRGFDNITIILVSSSVVEGKLSGGDGGGFFKKKKKA